jgi:hypothetical protein
VEGCVGDVDDGRGGQGAQAAQGGPHCALRGDLER